MLVVISPAKRLDWTVDTALPATFPEFQEDANHLAAVARKLDTTELQRLMKLSESLAVLNRDRFASFSDSSTTENARPAALAFAGDTYVGLEASSLDADEMAYAQDHLRILSGLYGLLRPLDRIQPYRLEMGSRLQTEAGKTLYEYWGDRLARALTDAARATGTDILINCASNEYFGAVDRSALGAKVVTPVFLEERDGTAKTVSFFAKKARGAMARFIVQNRVRTPEGLADFETGGYRFQADRSDDTNMVFVRDYPASSASPKKLAS